MEWETNTWSLDATDGDRISLSVAEVVAAFERTAAAIRERIRDLSFSEVATFYMCHDKQAGQLRCSTGSMPPDALPFSGTYVASENLGPVVEGFLTDSEPGFIARSDLNDAQSLSEQTKTELVHTDESAVADEGCGYADAGEERFGLAFIAAVQTSAAGEPGHGSLDDPAVSAKPFGGFPMTLSSVGGERERLSHCRGEGWHWLVTSAVAQQAHRTWCSRLRVDREAVNRGLSGLEAETLIEPVRRRTIRSGGEIHRPGTRFPGESQGLLGEKTRDALASRRAVNNHVFDARPQAGRQGQQHQRQGADDRVRSAGHEHCVGITSHHPVERFVVEGLGSRRQLRKQPAEGVDELLTHCPDDLYTDVHARSLSVDQRCTISPAKQVAAGHSPLTNSCPHRQRPMKATCGSGNGAGHGCLEEPVIAYEGPEHVEAACGQRENGLSVAFPLGSFALVEVPRFGAVDSCDLGGDVEHAQKTPAVATWSAHVAGDLAGVAGNRGEPGDAGQTVGTAEGRHVTAGPGDELGAEGVTDARHGRDHLSVRVLAKPALDQGFGSAISWSRAITSRARVFTIFAAVFSPGTAVCWASPALTDTSAAFFAVECIRTPWFFSQAANRARPTRRRAAGVWYFVSRISAGLGPVVVEGPLKRGKVLQHLGAKPVDGPRSVRGQVHAPGGEDLQINRDIAGLLQRLQATAHTGRISDDEGVLRIRLTAAPVSGRGVMHRAAGGM